MVVVMVAGGDLEVDQEEDLGVILVVVTFRANHE